MLYDIKQQSSVSVSYTHLVGKYGMPAQTALKKLNTLTFNTICATHGPIWRSHVCDIIAKYEKWSKYETEEGVVIAFSSMYGHTEQMADTIGRFLAEQGVKKIRILSLIHISRFPKSKTLRTT